MLFRAGVFCPRYRNPLLTSCKQYFPFFLLLVFFHVFLCCRGCRLSNGKSSKLSKMAPGWNLDFSFVMIFSHHIQSSFVNPYKRIQRFIKKYLYIFFGHLGSRSFLRLLVFIWKWSNILGTKLFLEVFCFLQCKKYESWFSFTLHGNILFHKLALQKNTCWLFPHSSKLY